MRVTGWCAPSLAVVLLTGCSAVEGVVGDASEPGNLFVHGEVLREGRPVSGAEVVLLIEDVGARSGSAAYDVPAATTGEDGRYSFEVDPDQLPARFVVAEEYVTFEVAVTEGADRSAWSSTVWLLDDETGWRGQGGDADDAVPAVTFDLARGTVEVTDAAGGSATYGE